MQQKILYLRDPCCNFIDIFLEKYSEEILAINFFLVPRRNATEDTRAIFGRVQVPEHTTQRVVRHYQRQQHNYGVNHHHQTEQYLRPNSPRATSTAAREFRAINRYEVGEFTAHGSTKL